MKQLARVLPILLGILSLCIAKPATTTPEFSDGPASSENEVSHVGDNDAVNTIADKEIEYRAEYAAQMLSYMNHSVQPCDDFYEYACGNWKEVIEPRQAEHKRNYMQDIMYKHSDIIEIILRKPNIDDVAPEYAEQFELTKKFYNNCLESEIHPMRKSAIYLDVIKQMGGFPAVDPQWNASEFSWLNMTSHLSNYGLNTFIKEGIIPQYPYPPYFQVPDFGFDIELHYDNIKNITSTGYQVNQERMNDILSLYEVPEDRRENIIKDIFEFLKAVLSVIESFDEDEYKCTDLSEEFNETVAIEIEEQWRAYYAIAWKGYDFEIVDVKPCTYFYNELNRICDEHKEATANYLSLKFLYHMSARLKDAKFHKDYCLQTVKSTMNYLFDHLYMKVFFNNDVREDVQKMMKEVRQSLRTVLQEADWLDETTREAALLKESTLTEYIGRYEDAEMNKRLLEELKHLEFVEGNYEANALNMKKFHQSMTRYNGLHYQELANTTKPLLLLLGMQVNAFYYNLDNSIYVTAGILHPPAFHRAWPNALKYATLGYLVGHEFTHGFDTVGAHYDQSGSNNYWWSSKSGKVFDKRSECYINHFQNYSVPEINRNINGNLTKDENIADGGGLRMAYLAYTRYIKEITKNSESSTNIYKDEQMPGLDLSPDQLFFLGTAQLWCSAYKEAHYWEELSDQHTIDKYRVLGMLSNNEYFSKAYSCPEGSKMNPREDKCLIW